MWVSRRPIIHYGLCDLYTYFPVARHTAERISSQTVSFGLLFILATLGLDMHMTSALQTYMMDLPNSRTQEREGE